MKNLEKHDPRRPITCSRAEAKVLLRRLEDRARARKRKAKIEAAIVWFFFFAYTSFILGFLFYTYLT